MTAEFRQERLSGARFEQVYLDGATFEEVDLRGARLREVDLRDVRIDGAWLGNTRISGEVESLLVNGVEVAAYVEAELNRRYPDRPLMRPTDR